MALTARGVLWCRAAKHDIHCQLTTKPPCDSWAPPCPKQRKQRRLSQHTLATLTGLDSSYISEIERGQRNVSLLSLLRIAEALHLPVSHLLAPLDTL
jgi:DNA-binding XRE family transcriptional regulator